MSSRTRNIGGSTIVLGARGGRRRPIVILLPLRPTARRPASLAAAPSHGREPPPRVVRLHRLHGLRAVEQHPEAWDILNCETCGAEYALPPQPSRPASWRDLMREMGGPGGGELGGNLMAKDVWLDAMPSHVLAALRRPHLVWQLGQTS